VIYQQPLAYLLGLEGLALLRAWAGDEDFGESFVRERLAAARSLLDDPELASHPGVLVEREATDTAYAQWARTYDTEDNGLFDLDVPLITDLVTELPKGRAIDAACGTGRLAIQLAALGFQTIGIDSSPAMLERARERTDDIAFAAGELTALPFPAADADLVVTGLALTHVVDLAPVYTEFARVLRSGGDLVVSDVHEGLVFLGSVVKANGPDGRPQLASTTRHSTADHLVAALAAGFTVIGYQETPRPTTPTEPLSEPTREIGDWRLWPWTLLGFDPAATRAAWNTPAIAVWHFRRSR
jgi:ubiquinone/menaquinone biosynthesis C-methylase UbiE